MSDSNQIIRSGRHLAISPIGDTDSDHDTDTDVKPSKSGKSSKGSKSVRSAKSDKSDKSVKSSKSSAGSRSVRSNKSSKLTAKTSGLGAASKHITSPKPHKKHKEGDIDSYFKKWDKEGTGGRKLANWLKAHDSSITPQELSKIHKYLLTKQIDKHSIQEFCANQGLTRLATISVGHVC